MAIQVYNHISVDLVFDSTIPSIDVMQGDTARGLIVTYLTEIDNLDNSEVSAVLKVQRADGEEGWAQGEVLKLGADMAQVVIDPSPDYTALIDVPGVAKAVLEVYSGDTVVSTFRFRIDVKENPFYGTTIGSLTPKQLETVEESAYQSAQDWMDAHPEASTTVADGSITSAKIRDGAIEKVDLANGIVDPLKLSNAAVMENKVAAVGATYTMANGNTYTNPGINGNKLAPKTVTAAQIADGTITEAKLAFNPLADIDLLGSRSGGTTSDTTPVINFNGYKVLVLCVVTSAGNRILATSVIPVRIISDFSISGFTGDNSFQANYTQGTTNYVAFFLLRSATTAVIASNNVDCKAVLYGIK